MDIHLYHHIINDDQTSARLGVIEQQLNRMETKLSAASDALDGLVVQATALKSTVDSAILVLQSIPGLITAAGVDPVKLNDLAASLGAKSDELAAAIVAVPA